MTLTLSALSLYPVKSGAGIDLQQAELDRFGLAGDRRWMLVDDTGRFITQRDLARLALLKTGWRNGSLTLRWERELLEVMVPAANATVLPVAVWADTVTARDAGPEAAEWLQQRLGVACRLVYMPDDCHRAVDPKYATRGQTVSFADGFPLLLISQASLYDLNARLPSAVPMNRFRPNLVITGCAPFAEDSWQRIRIANIDFDIAKPCSRCVIPSIDQATAERDRSIHRVLAGFRRRERIIYFGQNLLHRGTGRLNVGDEVHVLA